MTAAEPPTQPLPVYRGPVDVGPQPVSGPPAPAVPLGGADTWTFADVLAGLGVVLLLTQLLQWPFLADPHANRELLIVVAGFLPIWLGLGGTVLAVSRIRGTGRLSRDIGLRFTWADLALGLALGVGLRIAALVISLIVNPAGRSGSSNVTEVAGAGVSHGAIVVNLVLGASVIAPVLEEMFFRGLLIRSALSTANRRARRRGELPGPRRWQRQRRAVVAASAVLFALLHLSEVRDPIGAIALMLTLLMVGAVHAVVTLRTGRLGAAVISHVVFNGIAVALSLPALLR